MAGTGRIPTNLRALRLLEAVAEAERPLAPAELGRRLALPKQSVHRLCASLVAEGYLVSEDGGRRLGPGRRLRAIASGLLFASRFHIARHKVLEQVAAAFGETVNFVVPEDKGMTYRDRVETDWPFRIQLPIGTHVPFHCTASGKTFLASLAPRARAAMVAALPLERLTPRTLTEPEALLAALARIAEQGYAVDDEEFFEGMIAVAVPVRDAAGRYVAAIAVHGPTQRLSLADALARREVLTDAAARLGASLFREPDAPADHAGGGADRT